MTLLYAAAVFSVLEPLVIKTTLLPKAGRSSPMSVFACTRPMKISDASLFPDINSESIDDIVSAKLVDPNDVGPITIDGRSVSIKATSLSVPIEEIIVINDLTESISSSLSLTELPSIRRIVIGFWVGSDASASNGAPANAITMISTATQALSIITHLQYCKVLHDF